jgi:hypothetical protein
MQTEGKNIMLGRRKVVRKKKGKKIRKRKGEGRMRETGRKIKSQLDVTSSTHTHTHTQDIIYFSSQLSSPLKAILKTNDHLTADQTTREDVLFL